MKRNIWILIAVVLFINVMAVALVVGHNGHKETGEKDSFMMRPL